LNQTLKKVKLKQAKSEVLNIRVTRWTTRLKVSNDLRVLWC